MNNHSDYTLITVDKHRTPEQIRESYMRQNLDPIDKINEDVGFNNKANAIRKYYNGFNLRKRIGKK